MDALSRILDSFGVAGSVFSQARFGSPWAVHTDPMPSGIFHVIVSGRAHLRLDDQPQGHPLTEGDIVFMPHGSGHVMAGDPKLRPVPIASLGHYDEASAITRVDYPGQHGGDGQEGCAILCGTIRFEDELGHPLAEMLPPLIHFRRRGVAGWVDTTIRMLAAEVDRTMPGGNVMISKLAEMLFVQILRGYIAELDESQAPRGWIAGLTDPRVARALAFVHDQPAERWTASSLASGVGMSRSSFFSRFTELVGEPPTQYLTAWRMHLAKLELRRGELSMAQIADRVGYGSESALSKAFKRMVGVSPSEYRLAQAPAATG